MNVVEEMKMMVAELNYHTKLYEEGNPIWSDKEWDEHYFRLMDFEKETGITMIDSPTQKISYEVVPGLKKVQHNHPMLSLDKTKDMRQFMGYFTPGKDVIGMLKLDGLTCSLRYVDGKLVSAETRGNGSEGEDILHNARVIPSIPKRIKYKEELILDGEIICTSGNFKRFSDIYANPRNFAAGSIRLLDSRECSQRNLTFVVWNIVKGLDGNSFMDKLYQTEKEGFEIVPFTSSLDWDWAEFLQNKAEKLGYPIDGLVGRYDDIAYGESLGATGHHARAAYALKFYDEEYETILKDIEWTMGRTSVLTPVAIFEPVDDGESVIERASLHNISIMLEVLGIPFKNQKIKVFKANQIIPQISWGEKIQTDENYSDYVGISLNPPKICPVCGGATKIITSDSGVKNLMCENTQCQGKLINRLDHFCGKKGLDIKGLSKATLDKLIDWGWVSNIKDIFSLGDFRKEWIQKPGFGVKSVDNILNAIEKSKDCELYSFITALGIPLIGSTYAKQMAKKEPDWFNIREDIEGHFDFTNWDGFGPEMCASLWRFNYKEADELANILRIKNSFHLNPEDKEEENKILDGAIVVITGKLTQFKNRAAFASAIEAAGGKVVGSVSKNTTYLINNDSGSTSSKNLAAKRLGIEILTEEEFIQKFL